MAGAPQICFWDALQLTYSDFTEVVMVDPCAKVLGPFRAFFLCLTLLMGWEG